MSSNFKPSSEQLAIFNECQDGTGHLVIRARAGTGKTSSIIAALHYFAASLSILLCAFNRKIANELTKRIGVPNAQARTLHQMGLECVKRYVRGLRIESDNERGQRARYLAGRACDRSVPDDVFNLVVKLCNLGREIVPLATSGADLVELAYEHECVPDAEWEADGFTAEFVADKAYRAMLVAAEEPEYIDFSDMIFLPIRNKWMRPAYDVVIVDEAQDMTKAQLMLARGMCRKDGRIIVVGDDCQAIYHFRGADSDALDNLKAELNAKELPLTTTYRCGKNIVAEAAKLVPDFKAYEGNAEGEVSTMPIESALKLLQPGDFLLSRKNAPLVSVAMRLLREGRRARIEGRDLGKGLKALVKKLVGKVNSLPAMLGKLKAWEEKETARMQKAYAQPESKIEQVVDKAETIRALAEGLSGVEELQTRIDNLFSDHDDNGNVAHFITCSSVHKAKGLEADRVVVLADTLKAPSCDTSDVTDKKTKEEINIKYVAVTRAKNSLIFATGLL